MKNSFAFKISLLIYAGTDTNACSATTLTTQYCPDVVLTKEMLQELQSPCVSQSDKEEL